MQPLQQDNEFIVMQIKDVLTPTKIKRLSESDTTFGIFVPGKWQVVHAFPLTSRFSCSEPELIENLRQPALVRLVRFVLLDIILTLRSSPVLHLLKHLVDNAPA